MFVEALGRMKEKTYCGFAEKGWLGRLIYPTPNVGKPHSYHSDPKG